MLPIAEISAAPHLPHPRRPVADDHALAAFMSVLSGLQCVEAIEENGELRLVSHPAQHP